MKTETIKKTMAVLLPVVLLTLNSRPAFPCVAAFGYTGSTVSNIDSIIASVDVGTAYLAPASASDYIVDDVAYLQLKAGPVFILLQDLIFDPKAKTVDCSNYERGGLNQTALSTDFYGGYRSNLDTFFSVNADLFRGSTRKVYSLVIHSEANNACVETWKLDSAAQYVESKLAAIAEYWPIYTSVGYAFRNTPAISGHSPVASKGFPVKSNGSITKFPGQVDIIGYWVYDIFDPNIPSHSFNVNQESWTSLNNKLNQALNSWQKTAIVVKSYCFGEDPVEAAWGVTCPSATHPAGLSTWKIGTAAKKWKDWALSDSRNLFMIGFHWPDFGNSSGANDLPEIWGRHSGIQQQVNCIVP